MTMTDDMQPIAVLVETDLKTRVHQAAIRDGFEGRTFQAEWLRAVLNHAAAASERGEPVAAP